MLLVGGDGYKGDSSSCKKRVEFGNPHGSVRCWKCHISTTVGSHYVTRVMTYEEVSTCKGRPLRRAWHLLLGVASGGETHHPWIYPACGTCIPMYVLD